MNGRHDRLWLALRLRDLPLSALDAAIAPDEPVAVAEQRQVVLCTPAAQAAGVHRGMDPTTARLLGNCRILPRNPDRENVILNNLRDQLYRVTPHIEIHRSRTQPQAGLLLEVATCLRLFGDIHTLIQTALDELEGHDLRIGLAHTAPGAWLLSFARHEIRGDETTPCFIERLNQLPIQVLLDYPAAVEALVNMGFTTLGDVATQVRSSRMGSFTKRLGPQFTAAITDIYALDQDFGQASLFSRPVVTYRPQEHFHEQIEFDYPVIALQHLQPALESLLQRLSDYLRERQLACQHIQWRLSDIHRRQETVEVHCDLPQSDWQLLYDLTLIRFDTRSMPFEVDCLELTCRDQSALESSSQSLDFSGEGRRLGSDRELTVTMARLKSRVGDAAVHKVSYNDSLVPELSQRIIGLAEKSIQQLPDRHRFSLRPAWLFAEPRPVQQRGQRLFWQGYLSLSVGPERVTGHWWDEPVARDYYLAKRQDHVVVWLYRDLKNREWYVHGVFS